MAHNTAGDGAGHANLVPVPRIHIEEARLEDGRVAQAPDAEAAEIPIPAHGPRVGLRVGPKGIVDADFTYLISSEARLTAGYHVDVAGSGSAFADARVLDRNGDLVNPNTFIGGYSDSISKTKTFSLGLSGEKGRNTYGATASYIIRDILSTGLDEEVVSFDASYSRQLSRRTEWVLGGGYSEIIDAQVSGNREKAYYGQTGVNYHITPTFLGSLAYGHYNRDSENGIDSLRENTVTISLRKSF